MNDRTATTEPLQRIIERAVRDVLAEQLRKNGRLNGTATPPPAPADGKDWRIQRSPVTLADLEDAPLKQLKRLTVPPRAVVTPAVRDVLRSHNIELHFQSASAANASAEGVPNQRTSVRIGDADGRGRDRAVHALLVRRGLALTLSPNDTDPITASASGKGAVIIADLPQPVVAQVFTTGRRIAAQVGDLAAVDDVARQMQPDVWVIEARRASLHQLAALVERCVRTGGR